MGDNLKSNLTEGEKSYYFTNDNSNYILKFSTPVPFKKSGFQIVCSNKERNILTSSLDLYLLKEREIELIVKNEKSDRRIVSIETNISSSDGLNIETVSGIENDEIFIPLSELKYYYLILKDKLTFKITVSNKKDELKSFKIILQEKSVTNIKKSGIISPSRGIGITFYKIFNIKNYYSLYFKGEIPLYDLESNTKITKVKSNKRKKINDYELLYSNFSMNDESFYIDFQDENNSKKEEGDFSIIIYEPIQYDFTLVNNNNNVKRIQIKFKQNNYYEISKFEITNQNSEINYLFLDSDNYYVYQFKKTSEEIPISLHFSELKETDNSIKINLTYQSFDNDVIEINQNLYNCTISEEMYEIRPNSNKQYIDVIFNTSSSNYFKFNGKGENNQIFLPISKNNYLNILGSPEENICFQVMFYENNIFDLKLEKELNFNIIMEQKYSLKISNIEEYNNVELYIKTLNNNLDKVNIYLSGQIQSISKNEGIYTCTLTEPDKEIILDFHFIPKKDIDKEEVTIYYKNVNKYKISKVFIIFVYIYTFIALGLFISSLILFAYEKHIGKTKKDTRISYDNVIKRIKIIYSHFCKKKEIPTQE